MIVTQLYVWECQIKVTEKFQGMLNKNGQKVAGQLGNVKTNERPNLQDVDSVRGASAVTLIEAFLGSPSNVWKTLEEQGRRPRHLYIFSTLSPKDTELGRVSNTSVQVN